MGNQPVEFVDLTPGPDTEPADVAETHISVVVLAGGRAYKVLKPVEFDFLQLGTRDQRRRALEDELRVNRRFAPDVYLGIADIVDGSGRVHDHALVMRRLPAGRRLARLLGGDEAPEQIRRVARQIAAVHAAAPRSDEARQAASWPTVARNWADDFDTMEPFAGDMFDVDDFERVRRLVRSYLGGRHELFAARIEAGHAVDGHGDLLAEDIFCLDDGPRILDALAFDTSLRCGDALADVAFLAMDVERLAGPPLAEALMAWYRQFSNEHHPGSLAHFYVAYRAHVRAKVTALRAAQGDEEAALAAGTLHDLSLRHAERALPRLVLLGGGPGSGKTTLAEGIAGDFAWSVLGSDEVRKDLAGIGHEEHRPAAVDEGIYDPAMTSRTYDELIRRAGRLLSMGESVVIDASWTNARHRELARDEARRRHAALSEVCCRTNLPEATARVRRRMQRGGGTSDATPDVVAAMDLRAAAWPEAIVVDTGRSIRESLDDAVERLSAAPAVEVADR